MPLPEQLKDDLKAAQKGRETERIGVLRMVLSQIQYAEIDRKKALTDGEVQEVIRKAVKDRREAAALYRRGERGELADKEEREAALLLAYLPEPLTGPELEKAIEELLAELGLTGKREMGRAMKTLMERFRGRIDGSEASRLLAARLS